MNISKETVSIGDSMTTVDLQISNEKGVTFNSENNVSKETVVLNESVEVKIKVQVHTEEKSSFKVPQIHKETEAEQEKCEAMEAQNRKSNINPFDPAVILQMPDVSDSQPSYSMVVNVSFSPSTNESSDIEIPEIPCSDDKIGTTVQEIRSNLPKRNMSEYEKKKLAEKHRYGAAVLSIHRSQFVKELNIEKRLAESGLKIIKVHNINKIC